MNHTFFFCLFRASGSVFSAIDKRTRSVVAIKKMIVSQQESKKVLVNEVVILREMHHKNVVNFVDSHMLNDTLWVKHTHKKKKLSFLLLLLTALENNKGGDGVCGWNIFDENHWAEKNDGKTHFLCVPKCTLQLS
jgi:serine/threonine protein kinase